MKQVDKAEASALKITKVKVGKPKKISSSNDMVNGM